MVAHLRIQPRHVRRSAECIDAPSDLGDFATQCVAVAPAIVEDADKVEEVVECLVGHGEAAVNELYFVCLEYLD